MKVIRMETKGRFAVGVGHYANPHLTLPIPICGEYSGKEYQETDDLVLCLECRILTGTLPSQKHPEDDIRRQLAKRIGEVGVPPILEESNG